jgi:hypothetical protein
VTEEFTDQQMLMLGSLHAAGIDGVFEVRLTPNAEMPGTMIAGLMGDEAARNCFEAWAHLGRAIDENGTVNCCLCFASLGALAECGAMLEVGPALDSVRRRAFWGVCTACADKPTVAEDMEKMIMSLSDEGSRILPPESEAGHA